MNEADVLTIYSNLPNPRDGRLAIRVLHLQPVVGPPRLIRGALTLRDDALEAQPAGMLENACRVLIVDVLIELQPDRRTTQQPRQQSLAYLDRFAPQFHTIEFEQVERAQYGWR